MNRQEIQRAMKALSTELEKEKANYRAATERDEIFAIKKKILLKIKYFERELVMLKIELSELPERTFQ